MKFWDSSAIVPLLVEQSATAELQALAAADPVLLVWWGTAVECGSALARLEREMTLDRSSAQVAFDRLAQVAASWQEIEAGDLVRETAIRLLRVHPLRAADSLQLAAAFVAAEGRPSTLEFTTLDDRLALAAQKEGFPVIGPDRGVR
ncbi:MAG TPA: type II toxin-antitoxin system VapC family toxin [Reyranella sp.]|nr:type II toxin-antitoxin system VapC family toxin [Reyranella sp.]